MSDFVFVNRVRWNSDGEPFEFERHDPLNKMNIWILINGWPTENDFENLNTMSTMGVYDSYSFKGLGFSFLSNLSVSDKKVQKSIWDLCVHFLPNSICVF